MQGEKVSIWSHKPDRTGSIPVPASKGDNMKRKRVTTGIVDGIMEIVVASCDKCAYWDRCNYGHEDKGHCHRYPETHPKYEASWCGEFKPEAD